MWKQREGKHLGSKTCRHDKTKLSLAGLERAVCETCGHISVRYVGTVIEDDIYIPAEHGEDSA